MLLIRAVHSPVHSPVHGPRQPSVYLTGSQREVKAFEVLQECVSVGGFLPMSVQSTHSASVTSDPQSSDALHLRRGGRKRRQGRLYLEIHTWLTTVTQRLQTTRM